MIVQEDMIPEDDSLAETCRILNKNLMTSALSWSYYLNLQYIYFFSVRKMYVWFVYTVVHNKIGHQTL